MIYEDIYYKTVYGLKDRVEGIVKPIDSPSYSFRNHVTGTDSKRIMYVNPRYNNNKNW